MGDFKPMICGLVESKHSFVTDRLVKKWWGGSDCLWEVVGAIGASGGLICCWNKDPFEVANTVKGRHWLCLEGVLKHFSFNCTVLPSMHRMIE